LITLAPLFERELRAAVRTGWARMRVWTALSAVLLTMLHLSLPGKARPSSTSQELFHMLLVFSIGGAVLQTIKFSLDLVARERRNQTLGLVVLTGLSSGEIFLASLLLSALAGRWVPSTARLKEKFRWIA
jgi:hypothetical protein